MAWPPALNTPCREWLNRSVVGQFPLKTISRDSQAKGGEIELAAFTSPVHRPPEEITTFILEQDDRPVTHMLVCKAWRTLETKILVKQIQDQVIPGYFEPFNSKKDLYSQLIQFKQHLSVLINHSGIRDKNGNPITDFPRNRRCTIMWMAHYVANLQLVRFALSSYRYFQTELPELSFIKDWMKTEEAKPTNCFNILILGNFASVRRTLSERVIKNPVYLENINMIPHEAKAYLIGNICSKYLVSLAYLSRDVKEIRLTSESYFSGLFDSLPHPNNLESLELCMPLPGFPPTCYKWRQLKRLYMENSGKNQVFNHHLERLNMLVYLEQLTFKNYTLQITCIALQTLTNLRELTFMQSEVKFCCTQYSFPQNLTSLEVYYSTVNCIPYSIAYLPKLGRLSLLTFRNFDQAFNDDYPLTYKQKQYFQKLPNFKFSLTHA